MRRLIQKSEYKRMPWKNGLGLTAEIDRFPEGTEHFLWRLSQAAIEGESPFSQFPGYDRWLTVWRGEGIFLNEKKLEPLQPFRFSGDEAPLCRLVGNKVLDLGLIFDRAQIDAKMEVVEGKLSLPIADAHYLFDLGSGDTLRVVGAAEVDVAKSILASVFRRG